MHILRNIFLGVAIIMCLSFRGADNSDSKNFLRGTWIAHNVGLRSMAFMPNDMVRVVSGEKGDDTAIHMHYRIVRLEKKSKKFTVDFLQKDLVKDEYTRYSTIDFTYKNGDTLIMHSSTGGDIILSRFFGKENL
jgi:hypothetical protein